MIKHDKFIQFENDNERLQQFKHLKWTEFTDSDKKFIKKLIAQEITPLLGDTIAKEFRECYFLTYGSIVPTGRQLPRLHLVVHIYKFEDEWYSVRVNYSLVREKHHNEIIGRDGLTIYFACDEWEGLSNCISKVKDVKMVLDQL